MTRLGKTRWVSYKNRLNKLSATDDDDNRISRHLHCGELTGEPAAPLISK